MLALYAHGRPVADERHPVETEDGWLLTLHRYLPADGAVRQPVPIVLGHGINMNRTAFELSRRGSMARALAARGHDVFVAEYRGEPSARPPLRGDNARKRWAYTLMDHAQHDLPAIIDTAARLGRSDRVSWVGHSMGGILLYLYASLHGSGKLHRVVTFGSPVHVGRWPGSLGLLQDLAEWLHGRFDVVRVMPPTYLVLPIIWVWPHPWLRWNTNTKHVTRREALALCTSAFEDVSSGVTQFFIDMAKRRRDVCPAEDEDRDGVEVGGLARLEAPLLVVSAARDGLAPPKTVEPAYHRAGSKDAAYLCLPAFSHCDLISGRACLETVMPVLSEWLEGAEATIQHPTLQRTGGVDRRIAS
ncbi:MAG: alpha/beta fold hydrolase [Proteobacteria bacterium]|nr:alpha/beta fold hydrolase [Pseudomonadota bacterium]